jgi:hypothetical protein
MKTKLNILLIILLSVAVSHCNSVKEPVNFDYGHVENHTYKNAFFKLSMDLPADWVVQSKEQVDKLQEGGREIIAGDNKNMKAILKASEVNSATLLSVFQYEVGSAVEYNPNITLVAENLKSFPGIKNGSDYLVQTSKLLKQSQLDYSYIDQTFKKINVDKHRFYVMNASINYMSLSINQTYYAGLFDRFCLGIILSYNSDEQKAELEKVVYSMKFAE